MIAACPGGDRMREEVYHPYGHVKKAAAQVDTRAARLRPGRPADRTGVGRGDQRGTDAAGRMAIDGVALARLAQDLADEGAGVGLAKR